MTMRSQTHYSLTCRRLLASARAIRRQGGSRNTAAFLLTVAGECRAKAADPNRPAFSNAPAPRVTS